MKALLSSLGIDNLEMWADMAQSMLSIALILVAAWVLSRLARKAIKIFKGYLSSQADNPEQLKRVDTLGQVFHYVASVAILVVAGMLVLSELGISIAPILATAGVVGVAVGFGAQSLIKDYFTGFFLLVENQLRQGDVAEVGGKAGLVEEVTLRYVRLRDYEGNVHYVPNGQISTVTNRSRGFAFSVIDVGIAYRENVEEAFAIMRAVGAEMRDDPEFGPKILEDLEIAGVDSWADSAVVLRCRFKVLPLEQWGVRREFLRRLKTAFDAADIEIPFPHLTIYPGQAKDGSAPALHVASEALSEAK